MTIKMMTKLKSKDTIPQFLRYITTGGLAFILEYSTFYILSNLLDFWYIWANSIAMTLGFAISFILNRHWSFKSGANPVKQLILYGILFLINLGISNLLMLLFTGTMGIKPLISKIITIGILVCWNFVIYKKIIFKNE
ncbi:MAG TPA: GtrA family protein [Clostridiales bacterium]|nr:GtrA family protein [Clostridiales bacterium]